MVAAGGRGKPMSAAPIPRFGGDCIQVSSAEEKDTVDRPSDGATPRRMRRERIDLHASQATHLAAAQGDLSDTGRHPGPERDDHSGFPADRYPTLQDHRRAIAADRR